jgi:hypothetical protein
MWHKEEIDLIESDLINKEILNNIVLEAVSRLYKPERVYSRQELTQWAEANLDLADIAIPKQVIAKGWQPEEVFSDEKLTEWALARGFIRRIK